MVFFTKIRETVEAFRYKSDEPTIQDQIDRHATFMNEAISGRVVEEAVNLGVRMAVVLPSSWLLLDVLHQLTKYDYKTLGITGIGVAYLVNKANDMFQNSLVRNLPLHKLNPYFGNKLQETALAFRKK